MYRILFGPLNIPLTGIQSVQESITGKNYVDSCSVRKPPDKQNPVLKLSSDTAQGASLCWEIREQTLTTSVTK